MAFSIGVHLLVLILVGSLSYALHRRLARLAENWERLERQRTDFLYRDVADYRCQSPSEDLRFLEELVMNGIAVRSGLETWAPFIREARDSVQAANEFIQQILIKINLMFALAILFRFGTFFIFSKEAPVQNEIFHASLILALLLMLSGTLAATLHPCFQVMRRALYPESWLVYIESYLNNHSFFHNRALDLTDDRIEQQLLYDRYLAGIPCENSCRDLIVRVVARRLESARRALQVLGFWRPIFEIIAVFLPGLLLMVPVITVMS